MCKRCCQTDSNINRIPYHKATHTTYASDGVQRVSDISTFGFFWKGPLQVEGWVRNVMLFKKHKKPAISRAWLYLWLRRLTTGRISISCKKLQLHHINYLFASILAYLIPGGSYVDIVVVMTDEGSLCLHL